MKLLKKLFTLLVICVIFAFIGLIYFIGQVNYKAEVESIEETFVIDSGASVSEIATKLETEGFIKDASVLNLYVRYTETDNFIAGDHVLNKAMSVKEVVEVLTKEPTVEREQSITLIEGWTLVDLGDYFDKEGLISNEDFMDFSSDSLYLSENHELPVAWPENASMEGFIYPDTYRIFKDATKEEIVDKTFVNFLKQVESITTDTGAKIYEGYEYKDIQLDFYEIIILASIIEKEVFGLEDRQQVADIFLKRLNDGMRLQADSTVNYITRKGTARSSYDDIAIDNPYNSYKYNGLPPGPICNPSIEAINAVVNPSANSYYYFLTSPEGKVYYGSTLDEHNVNRKYL